MEPTLQTLIDKNKEEVRKAVEECEKRIENIRGQAVMEKRELMKKIDEIQYENERLIERIKRDH
jgi:thermostable 8-oxoguanine DNA glycosylase